jgi:hypothetical protein
MPRTTRTTRPRPDSLTPRQRAEALGIDTGSHRVEVDIIELAETPTRIVRVARRADPLNRVEGATPGMRLAASIWRQAYEHVDAERGMGPLPFAREQWGGGSVGLMSQERAMSAATWHRIGVQAMGMVATNDVVEPIVIRGMSLAEVDSRRGWRKQTASRTLLAALERLVTAYEIG